MSEHSAGYQMARRYYTSGAWNRAMLRLLVERGRLTGAEYAELTGEALPQQGAVKGG